MNALCATPLDDLKNYKCTITEVAGQRAVVSRTGWSGGFGYEIYPYGSENAMSLWNAILEAGKPFGIKVTGPIVHRAVERGVTDTDYYSGSNMNALEEVASHLVDLDKESDFIGKEALKVIKEKGVTEKLVGIELEGEPIIKAPENFWPVIDSDNKKIGRVSRAFFSPRLKKNIGLAIVDIDYAAEETRFYVATPNGDLESLVVSMPWFEADKDTHLD